MNKSMAENTRNIGIDVNPPSDTCDDPNCPFHANLSVRGQSLIGEVISTETPNTAVISRSYHEHVPKYERYERRRSTITAHKPPCITLQKGDKVKIAECRPISKTKSFVVVERVQGEDA